MYRTPLIRPAGGGKITFMILPWNEETSGEMNLCDPISNAQIHARIYTAKLPEHIAQKQRTLLLQSKLNFNNIEHIEVTNSDGPGNCLMIRLCNGGRTTVFTAFGMRRKPSRDVVNEAVKLAGDFLSSGAAVDRYLADQLLIYMALKSHFVKDSETGTHTKAGQFTTNELSTHLTTNLETIKKFLPVSFETERQDRIYRISCLPD